MTRGDQTVRLLVPWAPGFFDIELDLPSEPIGNRPQKHGLRQWTRVVKGAGRGPSRLARLDPFAVMPSRVGDRLRWGFEPFETFPGPQHMPAVVSKQPTLGPDKKDPVAPEPHSDLLEQGGSLAAVVPVGLDLAASLFCRMLPIHDHPPRSCDVIRLWSPRANPMGDTQVEGPMGKVHVVAGHVAEGP